MLGLNLLIRLGRSVLKGPVTDAGWLPAKVYRHLVLEALEEEDFPGALNYLTWAEDPLLAQIAILRLRLLTARHEKRRQAILALLEEDNGVGSKPERAEKYQALLLAEDRALGLLREYEARALDNLK